MFDRHIHIHVQVQAPEEPPRRARGRARWVLWGCRFLVGTATIAAAVFAAMQFFRSDSGSCDHPPVRDPAIIQVEPERSLPAVRSFSSLRPELVREQRTRSERYRAHAATGRVSAHLMVPKQADRRPPSAKGSSSGSHGRPGVLVPLLPAPAGREQSIQLSLDRIGEDRSITGKRGRSDRVPVAVTDAIFDNGNLVVSFDRERDTYDAFDRVVVANPQASGDLLLVRFDDHGRVVDDWTPGERLAHTG